MSKMQRPSGDEVREARAVAGHNQTEMAEAMGVTMNAVQGWEAPPGSGRHRKMLGVTCRAFLLYQILSGQITVEQARQRLPGKWPAE